MLEVAEGGGLHAEEGRRRGDHEGQRGFEGRQGEAELAREEDLVRVRVWVWVWVRVRIGVRVGVRVRVRIEITVRARVGIGLG